MNSSSEHRVASSEHPEIFPEAALRPDGSRIDLLATRYPLPGTWKYLNLNTESARHALIPRVTKLPEPVKSEAWPVKREAEPCVFCYSGVTLERKNRRKCLLVSDLRRFYRSPLWPSR